MCDCTDVPIGSHANEVVLRIPEHMADYRAARVDLGLSPDVSIDRCLVDEIRELWRAGIRTTGCCCGHNQRAGFIGVFPEDIPAMLRLGYEVHPNPCRPGDRDSFYPKSVYTPAVDQPESVA